LTARNSLNVAIHATISPGITGGIAPFVLNLICSLGRLDDGPEAYTIVVGSQQNLDYFRSFSGSNQRFVMKPPAAPEAPKLQEHRQVTFPGVLKFTMGPFLPAARSVQRLLSVPVPPSVPVAPRYWPEVPISNGFYESLGCDVLHIPIADFILCALPTIFNPHDLQHLHYPHFFSPEVIAWRETVYPAGCHFAQTVIVGSKWVKDDIVRQYGISADKIQVIPESAATQLYSEPPEQFLTEVKSKYQLEQPFAVYPAVTWQHKNHLRLLEGIACLRESRHLKINLVCTGSRHEDFWPQIEKRLKELQLESQVKFLGFVPANDLRAIYRLSQFLIEPSLFEACSLPIFEAWAEGAPVACSDATALPEQVGDAALLFNPHDSYSIANALEQMTTNAELRRTLRESGFRRSAAFDWHQTAKAYRAIYRRTARCPLTEEDRWLLSREGMSNPKIEMRQSTYQ
jgi:glycosyltransferase involved in cell wall biosynthesis